MSSASMALPSAVSFGGSNSGLQMGENHGSVTHTTNYYQLPVEEMGKMKIQTCDQYRTHYVIPSLDSRHFTGRETTLHDLQQKLFLQENSGVQKLALSGLGGIGKTQVALQLAHWVKSQIPDCSIFWAPALSLESFEQACWQIAREHRIYETQDGESSMELVRRLLSSDEAGKWLLIIDNADDIDLLFDELYQYLPSSKKGITLLTTRFREVAMSFADSEEDIIELQKMTVDEGIAFLTKIVREKSLCGEESTMQLLEELEMLPLAISQAAYYISRNHGMTVIRYLELMHKTEKDRMRLATREFRDSTRYPKLPNAVAATWQVSFNQIKSSDPPAADLLEFMSYLEPKAIPRSLLPTLDSEEEMDFAIGTLCSYGFLTGRDNDMFDIHRLVQLSTRVWVTEAQKTSQIITTVIQCMDKCFPSHEHINRASWRMYLPHALEILRREESKDLAERYSLLSKVGRCLEVDGRAKEAKAAFRDVCDWKEANYDEEDLGRLDSQHELAGAYESNGQVKEAVKLLEHVVAVSDRTLDEEHPNRLHSQHQLAGAYRANGQIKQAVSLLVHVVTVRERTLDEEHPDRLASQHELARAYKANGQYKKSVKLLEHVVAVRERTLDEEHPDRLHSQHELAGAYRSDGQVEKSIELLEHVVTVRDRTLGDEHPNRLSSQHTLAGAYLSNGQVEQAMKLLEHVVSVRERTLDEEHPNRLHSQHQLARAYDSNGQVKEAVKLLEYVVKVRERTLDEEHPDRLVSQHELAQTYRSDGQIKKAVELLEHVVAVEVRTLNEEHPSRLVSQNELAGAYLSNGQVEEAIKLLENVTAVYKKFMLDDEDPDRLYSQHQLVRAYEANGQVKQAIEILEHLVAVYDRTLDEEHLDRLRYQHKLAEAYRFDGQIKKAVELLEHVVAVRMRMFDEGHPLLLVSQNALARAYKDDGQLKQAVELFEHVLAVRTRTLDEEHPHRLLSQKALEDAKQLLELGVDSESMDNRVVSSMGII